MARRSINVEVRPKHKNESFEKMVRRFSKKCKKERVVEGYRDRMYYEKPSKVRKRKKEKRKKILQKLQREKNLSKT